MLSYWYVAVDCRCRWAWDHARNVQCVHTSIKVEIMDVFFFVFFYCCCTSSGFEMPIIMDKVIAVARFFFWPYSVHSMFVCRHYQTTSELQWPATKDNDGFSVVSRLDKHNTHRHRIFGMRKLMDDARVPCKLSKHTVHHSTPSLGCERFPFPCCACNIWFSQNIENP